MDEFKTADDVIEFALNAEQKAFNLYTKLANQSLNPNMRKVFQQFAREAMRHKKKLNELKNNQNYLDEDGNSKINTLQKNNFVVKNVFDENIKYDDALSLAIKREKASFRLYVKLAELAPDNDTRKIFLKMAQENANHHLRFDLEFEEYTKPN